MYREENDQVILTMSRDEYDRLLMVFAMATIASTGASESFSGGGREHSATVIIP